MEDGGSRRRRGVRLLVAGLASATGAGAAAAGGTAPLDVALWAVLAPLAAVLLLELVLSVCRGVLTARHRGPVIVLPEEEHLAGAPDPAVQAAEVAVEQARSTLLDARHSCAATPALLALAQSLHEAELDLAQATLAAGGSPPQALRDELALRSRPQPADRQPASPYG